ncbi:MAG: hypothetical protein KZQ99_04840 [Candidatus Thiodiazotropha sp. (ex Dulcina madagascariensis)]|nr:hypothetical protein [Candidatus Thiodiazotropha sp. (ex Dulcina madagascariensis)]
MKRRAVYDAETADRFYLRASGNQTYRLDLTRNFQTLSFEWAYRVRNRRLWASSEPSRDDISKQARADLLSMGIRGADLDQLGDEPVIEVNIPFSEEATGWEMRIMPWEFFLSTAISEGKGRKRPLVIRHLQRAGHFQHRPIENTLLVISSPGVINDKYQFDHEKRLLETSLGIEEGSRSIEVLPTPTLKELKNTILEYSPDIVHLTGVDSHEGADLLGLGRDKHRRDGFYLADEKGQPLMVDSMKLAGIINSGDIKPSLVTCNTFHSAPRTCALNVAEGAQLALGFQDEIDNALAEQFLSTFYRAWKISGYKTLSAFQLAFEEMKRHPGRMYGDGVVLWSEDSLLEQASLQSSETNVREVQHVKASLASEKQASFSYTKTGGTGGLREKIEVHPQPHSRLNYTLLHNNQNLFASFTLRKYTLSAIRDIDVEVTLQIGSDQFQYRRMFDMKGQVMDIADQIRVPLTWEFARTLKESVLTSLYINVSYAGETIYKDTLPIRLLPSDEWLDTKHDGMWLPSFVLPRDRRVREVIDKAQHYLMAINDDPDAGFDGYQSGDPDIVDREVQAIWSALLYDYTLSYIDPPPTYSESSQRLRTPEDVISGQLGTCIDLALLFAACLEYIGLYPVIFLLQDHAFPGYWRNFSYQSRFFELRNHVPTDSDGMNSTAPMQLADNDPWMIEEDGFDQLLQLLLEEELVPIETVCLTSNDSFSHAYEQAIMTLKHRDSFDAMLDIQTARKNGVTPLPLRGREE